MEPDAAPKHNDRPELEPGEMVYSRELDSRFRIISSVGQGRCSVVYEAESLKSNNVVALKVYVPGPNFECALWRELYILQSVGPKSNNIVQLVGYFRHKHYHCLVQELLSSSLHVVNYKMNQEGLSPWAIHKFLSGVLNALCVMHREGFVHADLKPANVMWSADDASFKVLDFGLSFNASEHDIYQVQSPGYQAPETRIWNTWKQKKRKEIDDISTKEAKPTGIQLTPEFISGTRRSLLLDEGREIRRLTTAIDMWSLGCLAMEAAVGHKVFPNPPGKESIEQLVSAELGEFQRISKEKMAFYSTLQDFVLRCLTEDPAKRLTAVDALKHSVIVDGFRFRPTLRDLMVFSSPVLRFIHLVTKDELKNDSEVQAVEEQIREVCVSLGGPVESVCTIKEGSGAGHTLVHFRSSRQAQSAFKRLSGRMLNGRPVVVSYFPLDRWRMSDLW